MIEFVKSYWNEALSILAIVVALVPLLTDFIKTHNRKVYGNIVDYKLISDATANNYNETKQKYGTLIILAINLFVQDKSFFVDNYEITAKMKSGTISKAMIIDGGITIHREDGRVFEFVLPKDYNFNLHKEIICEKDNVRVFELVFVDSSIKSIEDIEKIKFVFKNKRTKKTISVDMKNFPNFNKMKFLSEFEKDVTIF